MDGNPPLESPDHVDDVVVVHHRGDLLVVVQPLAGNFGGGLFGPLPDANHPCSGLVKPAHELPLVGGERRLDEDYVWSIHAKNPLQS